MHLIAIHTNYSKPIAVAKELITHWRSEQRDTVFLRSSLTSGPFGPSVAWLPSWQQHNSHVSWQPIQIFVFLKIEAMLPIYGYVQSTDFTTATSSPPSQFITLPARFLCFFLKYTIAEMKAIFKLRSPHPSAEMPLQGVRGSFLSVNCPHADITLSNVQYFSSFTLF